MTREMNVTTPRSAAEEARDPSTSPDRLLELTRDHPELQAVIVSNPACPAVAREWILAINPEVRQLHQHAQPPSSEQAPPEPSADPPGEVEEPDPDGVSVWGDVFDRPPAPTPVGRSQKVQVAADRGVVPLGAAGGAGTAGSGPEPPAGLRPAPPPPEAEQDGRGRRGPWLVGCGCLILALILVVAVALGTYLWGGEDDSYQRPSSDPAAEQTQETAPEEESAEPEEDPVSPAPEDALELEEVRSPTGNIACSLAEDSVGCSVADRDFSEAGLEDCEQGAFSLQVAGDEAAPACGETFGSDSAPALEYDTSAVSGDVACTSEFDGMTCWNTRTGQGFFVNRVTYETF